ncbi:MAG: DsbE family thiol:disulfide interchange protein, partial [Pseudomonadota bacterium]
MRILLFIPPIVFAGLAGLFVAGMQREDAGALPSARAGGPAPGLTLEELGSKPGFSEEVLGSDGMKLVNVWASWCAPCRVEHPQ